MTLLKLHSLAKSFGGLRAVKNFDLAVGRQEIVGLIGPNGSGKSTILNLIGGTILPSRGTIIFKEKDITKLKSHGRAQRGIARVFQENTLFGNFLVLENVLAGFLLRPRVGLGRESFKRRQIRDNEMAHRDKAFRLLKWVGLEHESNELAMNLPHGKQRLLGLSIAMATEPDLLLLDEPLTGMNAEEVESMVAMINAARTKRGVTIIVVEHNMKAVMGLCDRITVLNFGDKIAEGPPGDIVKNSAVIEAYLGTEEDAAGNS